MLNIYESQSICMTINEHAARALCSGEVPVTLYSVRMQLMNHEYILAVSSVIAVQMKSRNAL